MPRISAVLPGRLGTAGLSGAVPLSGTELLPRPVLLFRTVLLAGTIRLSRPAVLARVVWRLAGRSRPLSRPELARSLLARRELALPVSGWTRPGFPLRVPRLAAWPRLPLAVCRLPWLRRLSRPRGLPCARPARAILAGPRLLSRVLAGTAALTGSAALAGTPAMSGATALAGRGRHGSRRRRRAAACPLLGGLVSRWLPVRSRPRWPAGRRRLLPLPRSARCLSWVIPSGVIPSLIPRVPRIPCPRITRAWIPRSRGLGGVSGGTRALCVLWRLRSPWVIEPRGARGARGSRALLARGREAGPRTRLTWPGTANARHRVAGTLPGPVVLRCLPGGTWRIPGPGRHAALRAGPLRARRQVSGAGALTVPASRVALVTGVNGVGARFQVRVPLVSVAVGVGSATGTAMRAFARPAALTIHPVPPGHGVRCSPPTRRV